MCKIQPYFLWSHFASVCLAHFKVIVIRSGCSGFDSRFKLTGCFCVSLYLSMFCPVLSLEGIQALCWPQVRGALQLHACYVCSIESSSLTCSPLVTENWKEYCKLFKIWMAFIFLEIHLYHLEMSLYAMLLL